jgi:hypothetical protein
MKEDEISGVCSTHENLKLCGTEEAEISFTLRIDTSFRRFVSFMLRLIYPIGNNPALHI